MASAAGSGASYAHGTENRRCAAAVYAPACIHCRYRAYFPFSQQKKWNFAASIPYGEQLPLLTQSASMSLRSPVFSALPLPHPRSAVLLLLLSLLLAGSITASAQTDSVATDTTQRKGRFFPSPLLGYSPETRWYFGAGFVWYLPPSKKYPNSNPSVLKAVGVYTINKQIQTNINGENWLRNNLYKLDYSTSYYKFPDAYFGNGNATLLSDRETYGFDFFNVLLNMQRRTRTNWFAGGRLFFEHTRMYDITPGGFFDSLDITGEEGGLNTGLGPWLTYDTRDFVYFPTKGLIANISAVVHTKYLGSAYEYIHYEAEFSHFTRVLKNDVLAFNFYAECVPGDAPFNRLAELGGERNMRGHFEGRYRDVNYLTLQAEYRATLWKYFGVTVFGGIGEVAPTFSDFNLPELKYSYGIGGRLFIVPEDRVSLRVDVGFDGEGNDGVYVTFREAF